MILVVKVLLSEWLVSLVHGLCIRVDVVHAERDRLERLVLLFGCPRLR